ncbi:MAG TPA: dimethylmenaquinone methyltransferase [Propionibacteriaceae bacterium]|jgi:Demethylmenaquinone methyltransferase
MDEDLRSLVVRAKACGAVAIYEASTTARILSAGIRPVSPAAGVCGQALTVDCPPGDNLWLHLAVANAEDGDVIVATVNGAEAFGYWGEVLSRAADARGVAGLILDGCVRDGASLGDSGPAVFSPGLCMRTTSKSAVGAGRLGVPIALGGAEVQPGDVIVADVDGIVAVDQAEFAAVVRRAEDRVKKEALMMMRLGQGETTVSLMDLPAPPGYGPTGARLSAEVGG